MKGDESEPAPPVAGSVGRGKLFSELKTQNVPQFNEPRMLARQAGQLEKFAEEQSVLSLDVSVLEPEEIEEVIPAPKAGTVGKFLHFRIH